MNVKTGQAVTTNFTVHLPSTGAVTNADSLPTGTLYVNGTADAATVTVTNITTGRYKAAVTLPALAAGDTVEIYIAATVGGVTGGGYVWKAIGDTVRLSDTLTANPASGGITSSAFASGAITAGSIAADAIGASELAADAVAEIQSGLATSAAQTTAQTDLTTLTGRLTSARAGYLDNLSAGAVALASALTTAQTDLTTLVSRITGAVSLATATTAAAIRSALGMASANLDTQLDALPTAAENADATWDELLAGHTVEGSAGHYLTDAGAAADPLMNTVPGSYASGSAGWALGRIGSGQITAVSLVSQEGNITELIGGATYSSAAGSSFDWTDADNVWPTLTGATITVSMAHPDGQTASYSGSVVTATGSAKKVRLELTAVQSAALQALTVGRWSMMVWATLSGGAVIPLVRGYANVVDKPGP